MTDYTHDVLLITPAGGYVVARGAFASVTGNAADAAAEWRPLTDGSLDGGEPVVTHYACHTGARASTVAALPALASAIPGSSWHVTRSGIGTPEERVLMTYAEALAAVGLWLLRPVVDPITGDPTNGLERVER